MSKFKNNKGFTLIELLVVIALIAVSIGVVGVASSNSAQNSLRKCTHAADNLLSRVRINAMHRAEPVFAEFVVAGGNIVGRYYEDADTSPPDEIMGRNNITMTYTINGDTQTLGTGNPLRISFTRRGELILVDENGAKIEGSLRQIRFTLSDNARGYVIDITPATGSRQLRAR